MKHTIIATLLLVFIATACGQPGTSQPQQTPSVDPVEQLKQDIGQILLVGFRGTSIDEHHHIVRDLQQYHIGSVILFEYDAPTGTRHRNIQSPQQLRNLCASLREYGGSDLLISVDQEGGNVMRLRARDGFPPALSAQASARYGDDSVAHTASVVARTLSQAGINLDFAPCVDVNVNPACPVIGKLGRSFSSNPATVARCASIWLDELNKQHIIGCLKHFPGHGSATGDTHTGLVDVSDTWQQSELQPYRDLISQGHVDMVMVAHVVNRTLGDNLPASLSPLVVGKLLRDDLGFSGVIVTDDLAMGAITRQYGFAQALCMAIYAGCDLLCLSNNGGGYDPDLVPRAVEAILKAVDQGHVSAADIHASAERIRSLKNKYKQH